MVMEDLNQMSLMDAWKSPRVVNIRQRHLKNNLAGTQCFNCINNTTEYVEPFNLELFLKSTER